MEGRRTLVFTMVPHHTRQKFWRAMATTAQWPRMPGFGVRPWLESNLLTLASTLLKLAELQFPQS